jgi:16S rRNA A1518/A1519 N6-dimethyltransferase RsmA/KsgA/DIM1 with predicted DNA glycosylase/AP lyase activity
LEQDKYIHGMDWTFMHENGLGSLKNYRAYQYNLISGQLGADVLEVGSGDRGFTAEILRNHKKLNRLVSIEPSEGLFNKHHGNFNFPDSVVFDNKDLFHVDPETYGTFVLLYSFTFWSISKTIEKR